MTRKELEHHKQQGTIVALLADRSARRGESLGSRVAKPVRIGTIEQQSPRYSSHRKTVATAFLVKERIDDIEQHVSQHETTLVEGGEIARTRGGYETLQGERRPVEITGTAMFESREFVAPWDEYVTARRRWLDEQQRKAAERFERTRAVEAKYGRVAEAFGAIDLPWQPSQKFDRDEGKPVEVSLISITLDDVLEHLLPALDKMRSQIEHLRHEREYLVTGREEGVDD